MALYPRKFSPTNGKGAVELSLLRIFGREVGQRLLVDSRESLQAGEIVEWGRREAHLFVECNGGSAELSYRLGGSRSLIRLAKGDAARIPRGCRFRLEVAEDPDSSVSITSYVS